MITLRELIEAVAAKRHFLGEFAGEVVVFLSFEDTQNIFGFGGYDKKALERQLGVRIVRSYEFETRVVGLPITWEEDL